MPPTPARRIELTPAERRSCRIPVEQAAEIKGISVAGFKKYFGHLIERTTPGRDTVALGAVLDNDDDARSSITLVLPNGKRKIRLPNSEVELRIQLDSDPVLEIKGDTFHYKLNAVCFEESAQ